MNHNSRSSSSIKRRRVHSPPSSSSFSLWHKTLMGNVSIRVSEWKRWATGRKRLKWWIPSLWYIQNFVPSHPVSWNWICTSISYWSGEENCESDNIGSKGRITFQNEMSDGLLKSSFITEPQNLRYFQEGAVYILVTTLGTVICSDSSEIMWLIVPLTYHSFINSHFK